MMRAVVTISILVVVIACGARVEAQAPRDTAAEPSRFRSPDDGWLDLSGFLDEKYGFLPVAIPITEPAVGYGAAGALLFISQPLGETRAGFGRPDIAIVGGLGTENGSWGLLVGDIRHWLEDRLETQAGLAHFSANLDFHGIGRDRLLNDHPLRYNMETTGGVVRAKYRLGESALWAGLGYVYTSTRITFAVPAGTPGLPEFRRDSRVGGVTPSLTYDTRNNLFTPTRGAFVEAVVGVFDPALGGDDPFQRVQVTAMQFVPLAPSLYLGVRGDAAASVGDAPFYLRPFISLRGAPIMRYQGEEMAQIEAELRWQFWKRFSLVAFAGTGVTWTDFARFHDTRAVTTGGIGFRYELARKYGIHVGLDLAFGPDNTGIYVQVGSAWARP